MNRDDIINECINQLADDNINSGVCMLTELARMMAVTGCSQESFLQLRKHIIESAVRLTDDAFIREKIKLGERKHYEQRSKTTKAKKIITENLRHR